MSTNRLNQILVVDSIPVGDRNTAKLLFEDLRTYASAHSPSPEVRYLRVESGDELIDCIVTCRRDADERDIFPMLHIECHGSEDGLELADGSFVGWGELKAPITQLNIATRLNLMIVIAACTGAALLKIMSPSDRAPFWALIGPTKVVTAAELEKAYRALYLTLLSMKSSSKSIEAMEAATVRGTFLRTSAQELFERVWAGYKREHGNSEAIEASVKRIREQIRQQNRPIPTVDVIRNLLISREPKLFEHYRATFFMYDLFPEHANRFPVEYVP
jgi:hypothetical protein